MTNQHMKQIHIPGFKLVVDSAGHIQSHLTGCRISLAALSGLVIILASAFPIWMEGHVFIALMRTSGCVSLIQDHPCSAALARASAAAGPKGVYRWSILTSPLIADSTWPVPGGVARFTAPSDKLPETSAAREVLLE